VAARELFVWYRVRRERSDEARAAVGTVQGSLVATWPGLQARLLVRDEGETATWMETYSRSDSRGADSRGIDAQVEAAIAEASRPLVALIAGTRHVEAFDVVA
jgi:hypothetical protein